MVGRTCRNGRAVESADPCCSGGCFCDGGSFDPVSLLFQIGTETKSHEAFKKSAVSDSFLQTPESFQTVFWNKEYRLQLLVSETWLILISTNCSLIRPKDAFCGAERVLLENEYEHAVRLLFADGSAICRCEHICDELIEILHTIR